MEIRIEKFSAIAKWLLLLICPIILCADRMVIQDKQDYATLTHLFKNGISELEFGYVLAGVKPVAIYGFHSLDHFPVLQDWTIGEKEFKESIFFRKALATWNKVCSHQKNFILKAVPIKETGTELVPFLEVCWINVKKLQQVIEENLTLFRYILGPMLSAEELTNKIAYDQTPLFSILKNDLVLVGIILGFGEHNSLLESRIETLDALIRPTKDFPPFISKNYLLHHEKDPFLKKQFTYCFGTNYLDLAGQHPHSLVFEETQGPLLPSFGFSTIEEELKSLQEHVEPLPAILEEHPRFVFGAFKGGPSNQKLFDQLIQAQRYAQQLITQPHFLEAVLQKINGLPPLIHPLAFFCSQNPENVLKKAPHFPQFQDWMEILDGVLDSIPQESAKKHFLDAFLNPTFSDVNPPPFLHASLETWTGLKLACTNLENATSYFNQLDQDPSLTPLFPKYLYFKTTRMGNSKKLNKMLHAQLNYVVEDLEGNVLVANYNQWVCLSNILPSVVWGMQGMGIGEHRTLFIHPALGYGFMTTLPPCIPLIMKVQLIAIKDDFFQTPPLELIDFSWIQDPLLAPTIQESIERVPRFTGAFYYRILSKIEGIERAQRISHSWILKRTPS